MIEDRAATSTRLMGFENLWGTEQLAGAKRYMYPRSTIIKKRLIITFAISIKYAKICGKGRVA
jgi:hypothetical protein